MVAGGLVIDHDLDEYRLAPKRYHRKIRAIDAEDDEEHFHQPTEPPHYVPPSVEDPVIPVAPNTSFLLDLPYPSHFLVSLQMLNLSLPFIDTGIRVPEDPPTPEFDLNQVIKNRQYQNKPEENQEATVYGDGNFERRRRPLNRIRHRIPARRLPKRSADDSARAPTTTKRPVKFRSWNASNPASAYRRQELYSNPNKVRYTPTIRPIKKFQSKLLHRRANATKFDSRKNFSSSTPVNINEFTVESTTESPPTTPQKHESSEVIRPNFSGSSNQFSFQSPDFEPIKTRMGGFRPIRPKPSNSPERLSLSAAGPDRFSPPVPREKFIDGPPDHFVPIIPPRHYDKIETSTESFVDRYNIPPPATSTLLKPARQSKYISQFHSSPAILKGQTHGGIDTSSSTVASEEVTQIQKPETAVEANKKEFLLPDNSEELLVSATSTIVPVTADFVVPDLNFPAFELPSDQSKSATLPPPLSIEELIKKFTGKDLVTEAPSASSTAQPIQDKSTSTTTAAK